MIRVLKAGTITSTLGCFSPGNSIAMETNQEHSSCRGLRAGVGGGGGWYFVLPFTVRRMRSIIFSCRLRQIREGGPSFL